jgi:hypothetical protein
MSHLTIFSNGTEHPVVSHKKVAIIQPTKEYPTETTLVFFDEKGIPTHVANWNKKVVGQIMAQLNLAIQNMMDE